MVDQIQVQQLAHDPEQLQRKLEELRALVAAARHYGADAADCAFADRKIKRLEALVRHPQTEGAPEQATSTVGMLESLARGFGHVAEIGEKFETTLRLVGPAIALYFGVSR